jgi:uncharacterized protein YecE (DUF72 family)
VPGGSRGGDVGVYVGTAGWSYPSGDGRWDGVLYPPKLADRDKLPFYAQYFDAVELNSSFYRPPNPRVAATWAQKVPDDFRFTAKLWQKFTHPKMFEQATGREALVRDDDFEEFTAGIAPLAEAGKLGALLAQFPPSFKPNEGALDYLTDLIRRLRGAGFELAVELRHRDWTQSDEAPAIRALFQDEGVAWVMIDEPKFRTSIRDVPLTGRVGYFRFHGRNYEQWWHHDAAEDRYNYLYPAAEQQELAEEVSEVASSTDHTFAFYNNHYGAKAIVNAVQLKLAMGQSVDTPLPEPLVEQFGEPHSVPRA